MHSTAKAKYVVVQITRRGIISGLHPKKYNAADETITQLRRARIIVTGITTRLARRLYATLIQPKLDYESSVTPADDIERSEHVRLNVRFFRTILCISVQPHDVVKLNDMSDIDAPYSRRQSLCQALSGRLLRMEERAVEQNKEAGKFGVRARATLNSLDCNSWLHAHVENPRRSYGRQQDENMMIIFKKKIMQKWMRRFRFSRNPLRSLYAWGTGSRGRY